MGVYVQSRLSMNVIKKIPHTPISFGIFVSRPFSVWAILSMVLVIAAQALETSTYYIFKELIDSAGATVIGPEVGAAVLGWAILYPVAAIGHSLLYRASGLTALRWFTGMQKRGRDVLFEYVSRHSSSYFNNRFAGSLNSKIWNASDGVEAMGETFLWSYLNMAVAFIGSVYLVYLASPLLAAIFIGWVVLLLIVSYFLAQRNKMLSRATAAERSKLTGTIVDILTNMNAVRTYAKRLFEVGRVEEGTAALRRAAMRSWTAAEILLIVSNLVMGLFIVTMLAGSFLIWRGGGMTTGSFVMILTLMSSLAGWFSMIGNSMNHFARSYGEAKEGLEEILIPVEISDASNAAPIAVSEGAISFSNVTFAYQHEPLFKDFSLNLRGGERVGLVGPSGAGKTTLVSLLLRSHEVQSGSIKIDGMPIAEASQESLHDAIGYVPQEPLLFHRSIRENIAYGKAQATDEEIMEAARKAQAHDFIMSLPDGYGTLVGERGVKLSGGQRQRVAIARAILKNAPILVLDEATSALDSESEVAIQRALHELMVGKTVIAVAHRLSTLREMDRLIVLEGGTIVQDGPHEKLLKDANGLYARLWNHQAGGFLQEN